MLVHSEEMLSVIYREVLDEEKKAGNVLRPRQTC